MTGPEFKARARAALGGPGWTRRWAAATGTSLSTLSRWCTGKLPLPTYAIAQLETLEVLVRAGAELPARWARAESRRAA